MKVCDYCNSNVGDDVMTCPHCSASSFSKKCDTCGAVYTGASCPDCERRKHEAAAQAEENRKRNEKRAAANTGLGWKTALTVFLPFIGGYFLINDNVRKGFRYFGIAWCCFMALDIGLAVTTQAPATRALTAILCLAPVGVYLFRRRGKALASGNARGMAPVAAFAAVLLVSVIGSFVNAGNTPSVEAADAQPTAPVVAPAAPSASSSASSSSASASSSSSSTSSSNGPAAKDVTLSPTSKYIEYSKKQTDPVKLVKADQADATITANGELDLTSVGKQTVAYAVALGGTTATQEVAFTVRDTKAPKISFVDAKPAIDQGEDFDKLGNIEYVKDPVDGALKYVEKAPEAHGSKVGLEEFYDTGWYTIEGTVDSSTPGTHQLFVTACDKHGNTTTRELPVTVRAAAGGAAAGSKAEEHTYIANLNSKSHKFHLPGCRDVSKMKESNKLEITATREEMIAQGYSPCLHCNP